MTTVDSPKSQSLGYGYRLPIWDPKGTRAADWWPHVRRQVMNLPEEFESVWLADHLLPGAPWMPPEADVLESWTVATYVAAINPTVRVGHLVLASSFRQPALLAKMSATMQFLSAGRFILGLGAGWMEREYRAFGFDFSSTATRLADLEDALVVIRGLWSVAPFSHRGPSIEVIDASMRPQPQPMPPIVVGTHGESIGLRLVAQYADWWNASGLPLPEFKRKLRHLNRHCEAIGRDPDTVRITWQGQRVAIADSGAEARRQADANPMARLSTSEPDLVGTPELVAEMLAEFVGAGVQYFMLRFADFPSDEGLRRFAAEVIPRVRSAT